MRIKYDYLNDADFLKQVAGLHVSEYYALITALDWNEQPIEEIQGRVISGNINIDGNSSLRRTANLSLMGDKFISNLTNVESLISINKKVNIQIGYVNTTGRYEQYPMLWFPIGVFVITSASISNGNNGLIVSVQVKDKMCLLNGECGGTLPASTVFDNYETLDENGQWIIQRPTIYQIIRELVNHFGGQNLSKIIISDLDTRIKQVMQWTGSSPLYFLKSGLQYYMTTSAADYQAHIKDTKQTWEDVDGSPFEYGNDVGYIFTDFSYPGQLVSNPGQSIVSILDKIKNVLGNYEYFYDINGNFVFQQVKNFLNNSQSKYILDALNNNQFVPDYLSSIQPSGQAYILNISDGKSVFEFNDSNLILSYNNTPQYGAIKNDFIIWGIRKTSQGMEFPIRYHLAIDKKPTPGNTYEAFQYTDPDDGIEKWHMPVKFSSKNNFPKTGEAGKFYLDQSDGAIYKWGKIGDNSEYIELDTKIQRVTTKDWRTQLYFQGVTAEPYGTESNFYYTELVNEWPKIYDIKPNYTLNTDEPVFENVFPCTTSYLVNDANRNESWIGRYFFDFNTQKVYYCKGYEQFDQDHFIEQDTTDIYLPKNTEIIGGQLIDLFYKTGEQNQSDFKQEVIKDPTRIDYYLDFIDTASKITEFRVDNIGRRSKVLEEGENVNCIFQPWIPDIILIKKKNIQQEGSNVQQEESDMKKLREECERRGQDYYQVSEEIYDRLALGGVLNSAYQVVRQILHESTSYNESISIQTLPLYHLEPNTRITVKDEDSNIYGDYMINTMSFSLDSSSTLSISASRALERI